MDFVLVGMGQEMIEQAISALEFNDIISRQQRWQTLLPVVVTSFDFTFGLRCWRITKSHAVEVQSGAELSEGFRSMGEEEGVVIDIECQRQAVDQEDTREKIEVGQEGFAVVEACAGIIAGGVIQQIEQDLFVRGIGKEGVRTGIILPKRAVIPGLPAFDHFACRLGAYVRSQMILDRPTPNAGPIRFEVEPTEKFTGDSTVGGGRFGREKFGEQGHGLIGPGRMMVAAGKTGRPVLGMALGAGFEVIAIELVEPQVSQSQFQGCGLG